MIRTDFLSEKKETHCKFNSKRVTTNEVTNDICNSTCADSEYSAENFVNPLAADILTTYVAHLPADIIGQMHTKKS